MTGNFLTKLAGRATEAYVLEQPLPDAREAAPEACLVQRACYVFMFQKPGHRLLTSHGSALPYQTTLAEEVAVNTIKALQVAAGAHIRPADLPSLSYSVAVLAPIERITSEVHLEPAVFGLYLKSDRGGSAIILPGRTGIETPQDQIATAIRESGIDTSKEAITMYRFYVEHYDSE